MPKGPKQQPKPTHQEWETVTLTRRKPTTTSEKKKELTELERKGQSALEKRYTGGTNKHTSGPEKPVHKLEEDTGDYRSDKISPDFAKAMQQARLAKGMTQAQLAVAINEKQSVVQEYENGKAVPNGKVKSKLNRALGVTLPALKEKE